MDKAELGIVTKVPLVEYVFFRCFTRRPIVRRAHYHHDLRSLTTLEDVKAHERERRAETPLKGSPGPLRTSKVRIFLWLRLRVA